jgi:hypothetical protein
MRRAIHGVEVEVFGSLPAALLGELLGGFPEGDPARAPDLAIALEPAAGPPAHRPPEDGRPLFFHGLVQAREAAGVVTLSDGRSTARIAADGRRIELAVAPASLDDRHTFEHVLALIALVVALRRHGLFHIHAGVLVRADGRAVLVPGGGGAGKSTLTLALLEHGGLDYLGDDSAFLAAGEGGASLRAFPRPFHVGEATARAFPRFAPLLSGEESLAGKRSLDPRRAFPGRERAEAGLPAAVLLPRIDPAGPTRLVEIAPAVALGALLESSALLVVDGMPRVREHLDLLAAAVARARCFEVLLGRDLVDRPEPSARLVLAAVLAPVG